MSGMQVLTSPRMLFAMLKETYREWSEDQASRLAAALAYYTAFSIAPLLLLIISVAGLAFGREAAQGQVFAQLQGLLGADAASTIQEAVANSRNAGLGSISALIGLATLIWSASNVFAQLQDALNTIWEVKPDPEAGIVSTVKRRFISMTMVLGIGFILLVSLALSAGLAAVGAFFSGVLPGGAIVWQVVNVLFSFGVVALLFAAIYKVLPDVKIAWSDVWIGAAVTALLFTLGKLLIGLYLGQASVGSTFGAAGSLLVFLVWVYYSAQILFFGAEFTQVYARQCGSRIEPDEDAVPLTTEDRANRGIPTQEHLEAASEQHRRRQQGREPVIASLHANGTGEHAHAKAYANGTSQAESKKMSARTSKSKQRSGDGGTEGAPDAVKRTMWAGLVAGSLAVGAMAARRASTEIWRGVFHEDPPTKNV
ncbi:MAG: YihY/virulence factor BrkB family protein [Chloroflexota bacterium]